MTSFSSIVNSDAMHNVVPFWQVEERLRQMQVSPSLRQKIVEDPNWETEYYRYQSRGLLSTCFKGLVDYNKRQKDIIRAVEEMRTRNIFQAVFEARREQQAVGPEHHRAQLLRRGFQRLMEHRRDVDPKRAAFDKFRKACRKHKLMSNVFRHLDDPVARYNTPKDNLAPSMARWNDLTQTLIARDADDVPASSECLTIPGDGSSPRSSRRSMRSRSSRFSRMSSCQISPVTTILYTERLNHMNSLPDMSESGVVNITGGSSHTMTRGYTFSAEGERVYRLPMDDVSHMEQMAFGNTSTSSIELSHEDFVTSVGTFIVPSPCLSATSRKSMMSTRSMEVLNFMNPASSSGGSPAPSTGAPWSPMSEPLGSPHCAKLEPRILEEDETSTD